MHNLALFCVHEAAENELKKKGNSFREFFVHYKNTHREIAAHATALIAHHTLPVQGSEISFCSKLKDSFGIVAW